MNPEGGRRRRREGRNWEKKEDMSVSNKKITITQICTSRQ